MNRLSRVLTAIILFGLCANVFFYRVVSPLWFGLLFFSYLLFVLATARHIHRSLWILVGTAVYAVLVLATRSTEFVQVVSVLSLVAILFIVWYTSTRRESPFASLTQVLFTPAFAVFTYIKTALTLVNPAVVKHLYARVVSTLANTTQHSRVVSLFIGLLIAVPIITVLVGMFAAADPIYYSYVKKIFSPSFLSQIPWRIILTIIIIISTFPFVLPNTRHVFFSPGYLLSRLQMTREFTIVMGAVAIVMASFIVIQWPYIFVSVAAETDLSAYGVETYAEYVQKGFIELLRVSAFIYILLWFGLSAIRHSDRRPQWLFATQLVVLAEFVVLLLSIFRRVYLYQLHHGLTLIRVYGTFFLIWLTIMALMLLARHFSRRFRFAYVEGFAILALLFVVGYWNVERYIVLNHPPTVNKKVDYVYLSRMSADGVDGWVAAFEHTRQVLAQYEENQGELDAHARKEIAYSYYILKKLNYNYQQLVLQQATPQEFKSYLAAIVAFQKKQLKKEIADVNAYKITSKENEQWSLERIKENERLIAMLDTLEHTNPAEVGTHTTDYTDVRMNSWVDLPRYENNLSPIRHSFYESFVHYPEQYSRMNSTIVDNYFLENNWLDRVMKFNSSKRLAFTRIQHEIPLGALHTMQEQYFRLEERIKRQESRTYEQDISLDSPLL